MFHATSVVAAQVVVPVNAVVVSVGAVAVSVGTVVVSVGTLAATPVVSVIPAHLRSVWPNLFRFLTNRWLHLLLLSESVLWSVVWRLVRVRFDIDDWS